MNVSRMEKELINDLLNSNLSAKEEFKDMIKGMGSEEELMKSYGFSKREWDETKNKFQLG